MSDPLAAVLERAYIENFDRNPADYFDALARAARKQIAKEIEATIPDPHTEHEPCTTCTLVREIARIARGGNSDA